MGQSWVCVCVWLGSSWAGPDIAVSGTLRRYLCVSPAKIREEARKALLSTRCAMVLYNRSSCELNKLAQGTHLTQLWVHWPIQLWSLQHQGLTQSAVSAQDSHPLSLQPHPQRPGGAAGSWHWDARSQLGPHANLARPESPVMEGSSPFREDGCSFG